ncbi:EF-hand calcium-binding domain-containing protein 5 isoform X2 [Phasianus colchicus]|uniref:EF-hand calcium-binding domain-containing protein 5 isoform X2 n=1 Tax=Phasianus colchicus TaxID=9054 RepID=UPI00129EB52F|nr:EF-hand calcium-binding domain-containing protein 5 isoform X2 [Phasianus colchicus]
MAAQPEEVAQAGALKHPKAGDKCMTASEMERDQRGAELPCLSDRAPWKECFYGKVQQRSLSLQEAKVKMICAQKAKEEKAKKREPCDGLCQEWFSKEKGSLDARTYLADKLLPTLIPGVEKLLMEVERKDVLTSATEHAKFDPITFLGEYLMRHNPQYDTCTKPGPYLRGLDAVTEELKREIPDTASERLARMKSEVKTKRKEREQADRMKHQQKEMRKAALATQFKEWTADVSGRIPVALIQSAMKIFLDVCASTPIDARKACKRKLEIADTWGKNVNADEFIEYVHSYTENFPNDAFQEVLKHLSQCAADFQESIRRDTCKQMFIDLFLHCDRGQVGVLDRAQILGMLEQFYERSSVCARRRFCNPKEWPVGELQEVSLEDLWGDIENQEDFEEPREGLVLSQPEISEREVLAGDNRQGSDGTSTIVRGLLEQMDVSETETGGIPEEENQAAESGGAEDAMAAEAVEEPPARKEGFTRQHSHWSEQQTSSGTALQDEDRLQEPGEGPALSDGPGSAAADSQERKEPRPGDLLTFDLSSRHGSHGEKIPEDWGCENRFPDLHPTVADIQSRRAPRFGSPFDGSCLNLPRFVQLMETFVGEGIALPAVKELVGFIKEEYKQTEEEKVKQLEKAHLTSRLTRRELLLEALFEKWDIDASGFLEMKEVEAAMNAFKEGMEKEAVRKAKNHFCSRYPQLGRVGKLSPKAFQAFLELVASELTGGEDEVIDNIVEFLTTRVERSHRQCLQSSARRRWLHNIQQAAESSGARMDPVYDAVLKALLKDAEAHGDNKKISAYIALLEENQLSPERGQTLLRYVTCTTDDAPYVLNQTLYRDMKGVSFAAVEEKKPIHVPRVQLHGNIHFWNQDRPAEQRRGSFLVLPLQDAHWRVFGTLGLDTLRDQSEKTIFLTHEISFYQGVSHAFSKAYQHVCALGSVLQMALTALDWLHHRVPSIHAVSTYLVEPGNDQMRDYALRRTITTDTTGQKEIHTSPVLLLREENLFRDYLFKCIDCSEVVCRSVCGEQHIAVPLRDPSGRALGLFDISIRPHQTLSSHEHKELQRMLKMTQAACSEILKMPSEETKASCVLEAEHRNVRHAGILFHRLMLQDLRERIQKLNAESFAEIKSYEDPPALVHNTMKAVLLLLHPEWEGTEKIENWNQCILQLDDNLIEEMYCFDPTAASVHIQAELVQDCINGAPQAAVWPQGSITARLLEHWVQTCLCLVQLTESMQSSTAPSCSTAHSNASC